MSDSNGTQEKQKAAKVRRKPEPESVLHPTFAAARYNISGTLWDRYQQGNGLLQRQCACGTHTIGGGECDKCRRQRESNFLQQKVVNNIPNNVKAGDTSEIQLFPEARGIYNFSRIKVHTDIDSNRFSRELSLSTHQPREAQINSRKDAVVIQRYEETTEPNTQLGERTADAASILFPGYGIGRGIRAAYSLSQLYEPMQDITRQWLQTACQRNPNGFLHSREWDAFGHCWIACEGSRKCGELPTALANNTYEALRELGYNGPHDSLTQDLRNEAIGRSLSFREGICSRLCDQAHRQNVLDLTAPITERCFICSTNSIEQCPQPQPQPEPEPEPTPGPPPHNTITTVLFERNSARLRADYHAELDGVVSKMLQNRGLVVEIQGHTSTEGSEEHNMNLSEERAESVKRYLLLQGLSEERVRTRGYGETKPQVRENGQEFLQRINRRVEIILHT